RRGLGVAEHHADLLADLVDEDHDGARARDGGSELAERLGHEASLEARQRVAHIAVELGARDQRRQRVDPDHVDGVGPDAWLGNPSSRQAAYSERHVERDGARRNDGDLLEGTAGAQAHDRALAKLPLDLRDRQLQGLPSLVLSLSHATLLIYPRTYPRTLAARFVRYRFRPF